MHIALLSAFFPPEEMHGIARYIEDLAIGLAQNGHNVTVISTSPNLRPIEQRSGITIYWIERSKSWWSSKLASLARFRDSQKIREVLCELHLNQPFDIIEYPNDGITAISILLQGISKPNPRFIVRLSSPKAIFKKNNLFPRLTELLEKWQTNLSDAIISNTFANLHLCEEIYKIPLHLARTVILHGIQQKNHNIILNNSINKHGSYIFFIGRMENRKGFDILATAWPNVVAVVPDAKLLVAGEDIACEYGPSYFQWATRKMPQEALNNLQYLGPINAEQREILYSQCDFCVMPSRYESFGLVPLEIMRYAKPVISCQVGGIPEVITHGETGWLVPPEDPIALAEAIICLLKDKPLREKLGKAAQQDLKQRFTIERMISQTERFYSNMLKL